MEIDLRNCIEGDLLISSQGAKLRYLRPTNESEYLDHVVEYLEEGLGKGTRTHDGYVFAKARRPETDHDIIEIIKQQLWK